MSIPIVTQGMLRFVYEITKNEWRFQIIIENYNKIYCKKLMEYKVINEIIRTKKERKE